MSDTDSRGNRGCASNDMIKEMDVPYVSIGLPVYNGETYVREAIESILSQTYENFELIISDNASTDDTGAICRRFASKDPRVHYRCNRRNLGAAPNFNRTLALARGAYFKWAAHDDFLEPTYLEKCVEVLDADSSVVLCAPRTRVIRADGSQRTIRRMSPLLLEESPSERLYGHLIRGGHGCYPVFGLIRRSVLNGTHRIGSYVESDQVLLAELAMVGRFAEIPECLLVARDHDERSIRTEMQERQAWFDTRNSTKQRVYPKSRLLRESVLAVLRAWRSGMPLDKAVQCLLVVGVWGTDWLSSLKKEAKNFVGRPFQSQVCTQPSVGGMEDVDQQGSTAPAPDGSTVTSGRAEGWTVRQRPADSDVRVPL
ncbi:glycosyltransferase family 2 protein [Longibacter salinarum]|nr:glycosyltransferase family 2 protein [Longibacter salinarum]